MSGTRVEFRLPDVGEGLDEAEVVTWLVAEGDQVSRDQPLVEVLTDKAQVELPSPVAGRVVRLAAASGERVQVGTVLVELETVVGAAGAGAGGGAAPGAGAEQAAGAGTGAASPAPSYAGASGPAIGRALQPTSAGAEGVDGQPQPGPQRRPKASPSTRRLAVELGVDLREVPGTGPGGRILADDVRAAASGAGALAGITGDGQPSGPGVLPASTAQPSGLRPPRLEAPRLTPAPPAAAEPAEAGAGAPPRAAPPRELGQAPFGVMPLQGIRRLTAEAMARSWSEIPHITGMDEVDATELLAARQRLRVLAGEELSGLTPLSLLALAVVSALRRFPLVNATLDREAGTITVHERINLGIAVATDAGLVVPVVTDADRRGLVGLAAEMARLANAARSRKVTPTELRGGTFTITNYGARGGRFATPIIRPGESGIMGFGAIRPRPIVVDGVVEARPTLPVVFSADHRLIDGDLATAFQEHVIQRVREPLSLLLEV